MSRIFLLFVVMIFISGCAGTDVVLKKASWSALAGWKDDQQAESLKAFKVSCRRIVKNGAAKRLGKDARFGTYGEWHPACRAALTLNDVNDRTARRFFEQYFTPYAVSSDTGSREGLFTGYYESSLKGSRTRRGVYQTPLRQRPDDLVMVQLGEFRDDLKGRRIAGRVVNGKLRPYEDRAGITQGKLPRGQDESLVWIDNPVDAFFVEIQGSGRVMLDDGSSMRVGYAGQNGHSYYAIGRELIKRGELTKKNVSLQSIRDWLKAHPNQAAEIMNTNRSYVFFQEVKGAGPKGGEGVALTPERSLAVDHSLLPYGLPIWLQVEHPAGKASLKRLMVAQDTGGAIRGPVRGDVFWGHGKRAELLAGQMTSKGRVWILLPQKK